MISANYRNIIRGISINVLKKKFPGLNKQALNEAAKEIAVNIHARMYGANVDGVASPIWRNDTEQKPNVDASELLKIED